VASDLAYRRVLLKLSGEALASPSGSGFDDDRLAQFAREITDLHSTGVEVGIVVGGGNIFRGGTGNTHGIERATADYIGMLGTIMNALALQAAIEHRGVGTRVLSALQIKEVAEPYIRRRATRHLEKGRIVLFAAGTGNPFFTTDTAASLRAIEIGADVLIKATRVDGVYDSDPEKNPDAKKYAELTYLEVLSQKLQVMDSTAISLCMDNDLPVLVYNLLVPGNLLRAACGEPIGTIVRRGAA